MSCTQSNRQRHLMCKGLLLSLYNPFKPNYELTLFFTRAIAIKLGTQTIYGFKLVTFATSIYVHVSFTMSGEIIHYVKVELSDNREILNDAWISSI